MTRAALVLLLLALPGYAAPEEIWAFEFGNGDRIHGALRAIRSGTLLLRMDAAPSQAVAVRLRDVVLARRREPDPQPKAEEQPVPPMRQILRLWDDSAMIGHFRGIEKGRILFAVDSIGVVGVEGTEIAELLPTAAIVDAYYRSVSPRDAAKELPESRFDALWSGLGRRDPDRAWRARRALVRAGDFALPWLDGRLRRQPDAPGEIRRLVAVLDADSVARRFHAQVRLQELGQTAEPVLRDALKRETSPEVRRRVQAVLRSIDLAPDDAPAREVLRVLRAVAVLEEIGTPEARQILDRLARGAAGAETTRAAREALGRLATHGRG